MTRRTPPPLWFALLVAAALALALRALEAELWRPAPGDDQVAPLSFAVWGFLVGIVSAIWTGVQVAAKVTLTVLAWSVKALWFFATKVWDGVRGLAGVVGKGLQVSWQFLRATYDHVLKPAWSKFWKFIENAKRWLDKYVGPVLKFLDKVRRRLLAFYEHWIRPILDTIGIARRVLQLLARLGVDWARALDAKLAALEERIDGVFRRVLAELNAVINVVNRVVTLDGLFQRLALIRSIERDIRYVSRAFVNWRSAPVEKTKLDDVVKRLDRRTPEEVRRDFADAVEHGGGPYRAVIAEQVIQWRIYIEGR